MLSASITRSAIVRHLEKRRHRVGRGPGQVDARFLSA